MKPTPLQLWGRYLLQVDLPHEMLYQHLESLRSECGRSGEITRYLLAASRGGILPSSATQRGSLKNILWWLRDHAGCFYEEAVMYVFMAIHQHTEWPLAHCAAFLLHDPVVGGCIQQCMQTRRQQELLRHIVWETLVCGRVAWNRTTLNLAKIVWQHGADWYVALSDVGGCVMRKRDNGIYAFPLQDGWVQPYANLVLLTRRATLQDEATVRAFLLQQKVGQEECVETQNNIDTMAQTPKYR